MSSKIDVSNNTMMNNIGNWFRNNKNRFSGLWLLILWSLRTFKWTEGMTLGQEMLKCGERWILKWPWTGIGLVLDPQHYHHFYHWAKGIKSLTHVCRMLVYCHSLAHFTLHFLLTLHRPRSGYSHQVNLTCIELIRCVW